MKFVGAVIVSFLALGCAWCDAGKLPSTTATATATKPKLLILDVDNTIYQESLVGIEKQIVANTHAFCEQHLDMSKAKADDLFKEYGSTIEGLRSTIWNSLSADALQNELRAFYDFVYSNIDMSTLLPIQPAQGQQSTGYSHDTKLAENKILHTLLKHSSHDIVLASNSPKPHVHLVLQHLGFSDLFQDPIRGTFTPDRRPGYPTKHDPLSFFHQSFGSLTIDVSGRKILIIDDSLHNLDRIMNAFSSVMEAVHITPDHTLLQVLRRTSSLVDPSYHFDQVKYLESKNEVDRASIHGPTYQQVIDALQQRKQGDKPIRIADVGAGLLSMLHLFVFGDAEHGLEPIGLLNRKDKSEIVLEYTAFESNQDLVSNCQEKLLSWGFRLVEKAATDEWIYENAALGIRLRLCMTDFDSLEHNAEATSSPDLIVGCCFADLFDPNRLVPALIRRFSLLSKPEETLLYFPITFTGTTQFLPPKPFEFSDESGGKSTPSDTTAFQIYSEALEQDMGHNLNPALLMKAVQNFGGVRVSQGPSPWKIDAEKNSYLEDTMLYFFGTAAGPRLLELGWDAQGWVQRAKKNRPNIQVSNIDLLFKIGNGISDDSCQATPRSPAATAKDSKKSREIQFVAPQKVTSIEKDIPALGPNEVLIESMCSLISSGTELKIFKGSFDDAALDVNIKGMDEERMAYPLSYGYSLVGKVIACGKDVSSDKFLGKTVFTFSPHGTHVTTDVDAIQVVPDGISPEDAIFMPSVETALSLVHDAHVRVGENIAVYGQGLIGLLVTAVLRMHNKDVGMGNFGTITAFDTLPDRLAAASKMGASQALLPGGSSGLFDVSIEVSGNARALQSAIDNTSDGGRVIIGSWYGNNDVKLKLGIDFHRSHKTIMTSQVSSIPAHLLGLWNKERRFGLTWELVKQIKPSTLLTKTVPLENVQEAYEALEKGSEIAISFDYR